VVSVHGHKDLRRRLVRQQRRANGRKVRTIGPRDSTLWNIVANAAIRTGGPPVGDRPATPAADLSEHGLGRHREVVAGAPGTRIIVESKRLK
jgi:hypothetical protein